MAGPIKSVYYLKGSSSVLAGTGGNVVMMTDAYRQITLEKPATGELKTWLEANAVRLPLEGTWVFKNAPTAPSLDVDSREISSSTNISILFPDYTGAEPLLLTRIEASSNGTISFETYIDGEPNLVGAYSNGTWEDSSMRVITFTQPVQYQGNEEFVKWFTANAVYVSAGKATVYKLNESITCSTTQSLSGTGSNSKNLYAYNCTPYFTEIPTGSKILLSNGNLDDLTGITVTGQQKITLKTISNNRYLNPSLKMLMHYSKDVTVGDNTSSLIGSAQTTSGGMTMQGMGKVYCPSSMTYTTNNEILLFSIAPSGDLLTWLNTNAIKI